MSKLHQCPYSEATKYDLQEPCLHCETFSEHFAKEEINTVDDSSINTIGLLLGNNLVELGATMNGCCYKDSIAFETGTGICYIPEYGVDEAGNIENSYTRENIYSMVRGWVLDELDAADISADKIEKIIEYYADNIFEVIDWQFPETYLSELDFDLDVIEDYLR